jgi:hypothetical protein
MAVLYITEYAEMQIGPAGRHGQMPMEPPLAEQTVNIGSVASSSAFNAATRFVRLHCDAVCSVEFGTSPTASSTTGRMAANQTEYRGVPLGQSYKVSVITNT